jgi:hypothetical protein
MLRAWIFLHSITPDPQFLADWQDGGSTTIEVGSGVAPSSSGGGQEVLPQVLGGLSFQSWNHQQFRDFGVWRGSQV